MGKYKKENYGNPIVSAWISQDGSFAFVEFRTIDECREGFAVGQLSLYGRPLKVGRTKHSLNSEAVERQHQKFPTVNPYAQREDKEEKVIDEVMVEEEIVEEIPPEQTSVV